MYFRYLFLSLCCLLMSEKSLAQVNIEAKIDSISILVGQQTNLEVSVTAHKNTRIQWPNIKPLHYLVPGIEVVDISDGDTTELDDTTIKISKRFTLTSFDEKLYPIPGIVVKVDGKRYKANQLALKVIPVDVDTIHPNKFYPPKSVQDNPFLWAEWSGIFLLSILLLLFASCIFYLYLRLRENKPIITSIRIVKKILPHQRALSAIKKIKAEHLERSEDQKAYYTQLTDTLRQYIDERFGFNAREMTSSEIIERLQQNGDEKMIDELNELFKTADLVKFAKYSTLINENDLNLVNAINFIDQTKLENVHSVERITPKLSLEDEKIKNTRSIIKILITVLSILMVSLFVYIVYSVIQIII